MKARHLVLASLVGLTLVLAPPPVSAQSARKLNTQGFRLYEQKKYPEALEKFQQAIEADPKHALAHYNSACVLAILRKQDLVCQYNAYKSTIIEHLEQAVKLDPRRRARMKQDPDLEAAKEAFGYHMLVGRSLKATDDIRAILEQVPWFGPAPGAYGPMSGADFAPDGKASFWYLDITGEQVERKTQAATFRVEGTRIRIQLDQPVEGKSTFEGTLKDTGELDIPGLGKFTDNPDECSA